MSRLSTQHCYDPTTHLLLGGGLGVVEDVEHAPHLGVDGAKAQRVADGGKPRPHLRDTESCW